MEANTQNESSQTCTYVFDTKKKMNPKPTSKFRLKIWQILPSVLGCVVCVPFGLMLGWPSPTYPSLLKETSSLAITIDQSAMIAGFLMIGNTLATPFSQFRRFGSKYGIVTGAVLTLIGWILMWLASDIYWLLASRIVVGLGNGYGVGQLKLYISEICQNSLAAILTKCVNLFVFGGVILAFGLGAWADFKQFSIACVILSVLVLFLAIFLPSTPRELIHSGRINAGRKLIAFLSPNASVDDEVAQIKESLSFGETSLSFCEFFEKSALRKQLFVFAVLVFFQQFSGIPSTIVYSQIMFTASKCPRPELCAILYALVYFLANAYAIFCLDSCNKRRLFLFSAVGVSLVLVVVIVVLVERLNETFWNFTFLLVILLYNVAHTLGLGNAPFQLITEMFQPPARKLVVQFFIMFHSVLALVITKIFQVMFDRIGLFAPFCLFLVISTFAIVFAIVFVPDKKQKLTG